MAGTPAQNGNSAAGNSDFSRKAMDLATALQWPMPMSRDHRSGHAIKSDEELWGKKGRPLERVATSFRSSRLDQVPPNGDGSSDQRRSLNPRFVEWLMGWPIGWTASEPVETGLSLWLQRSRTALSMLLSRPEPAQGQLL
jgi:DNA (cytosine-5)-methyltransferase 1